jgi:hypothetical protein
MVRVHVAHDGVQDLAAYLARCLRRVDEQMLTEVAQALIDEGYVAGEPAGYRVQDLLERAFGLLGEFLAEDVL